MILVPQFGKKFGMFVVGESGRYGMYRRSALVGGGAVSWLNERPRPSLEGEDPPDFTDFRIDCSACPTFAIVPISEFLISNSTSDIRRCNMPASRPLTISTTALGRHNPYSRPSTRVQDHV